MTTRERNLLRISIPKYTFKQELFNGVSHFLGAPIGLATIVIAFVLYFVNNLQLGYFIGLLVFGLSTIALYLVSGLYHIESPNKPVRKKIKRVLDHCTIYLLIAGTYTPICIYIASYNVIGIIILIIEWFLAIVGILMNAIDFTNKIVKAISMFLYLALGWMIVFAGGFIYLPYNAFLFILIGGILYTIGSILYGVGHKNLSFHSIFHIFVLLGTLFQCIGVFLLFI